MPYRLTSAQRLLLADCVRTGLVGWLITCPVAGQQCRILQARATSLLGFGFARFTTMAANHFGSDYRPRRPGSTDPFPLSIAEAAALANDVELEMAGDHQLYAAALIAAHSPYAQPEIRGRDWHTYVTLLGEIGIDPWAGGPAWNREVRDRLRPFRHAVAASHAIAAE
jgi:hypothetical protein